MMLPIGCPFHTSLKNEFPNKETVFITIDLSKCQYCFLPYDDCTCCKYCGFVKGTCECHREGDYPSTKLHPTDCYKMFYKRKDFCLDFGFASLEQVDEYVMRMYSKETWPDRLKNDH